jgi:hypothetical protein
VSWLEDIGSLAPGSITGLMFSNELPDAFQCIGLKKSVMASWKSSWRSGTGALWMPSRFVDA